MENESSSSSSSSSTTDDNDDNDDDDLMPSFVQWTHDQIYQEAKTSHRKFFRERLMPEHVASGREGRAKVLPCEEGSYWRGFAFTDVDRNKMVDIEAVGDRFSMSIGGEFRTMVDTFQLKNINITENVNDSENENELDSGSGSDSFFPASLEICKIHAKTFGHIGFRYDGNCVNFVGGNPPIDIEGMNPKPSVINGISMLETVELDHDDDDDDDNDNDHSDGDGDGDGDDTNNNKRIEKMTLGYYSTNNDNDCSSSNLNRNQPKFVKIPYQNSIQTLIFEPRLVVLQNTVIDPLIDGGGDIMNQIGGEQAQCSNVPRTFLNENHCRLSMQASTCAPAGFVEGTVKLSPANIKKFYGGAWRYGEYKVL